MDYFDGSGMMGGGLWGGIFGFFMMAVLVIGVIALVRYLPGSGASQVVTAKDILKVRYAKGEIDKKEFDEKNKDL